MHWQTALHVPDTLPAPRMRRAAPGTAAAGNTPVHQALHCLQAMHVEAENDPSQE